MIPGTTIGQANRADSLQAPTDKTDGSQPLSVLSVPSTEPRATTEQLLAELHGRGVTLRATAGRIRYSPRTAVTPDLIGRILEHKAELLVLLRVRLPLDPTYWDSVGYPTAPLTPLAEERPCRCCFGTRMWRRAGSKTQWFCEQCHPPLCTEIEVRDA